MSKQNRKQNKKIQPRPIRYWPVVFVVMVIGGVAALLLSSMSKDYVPKVEGAPRVEVDTEMLDYGEVKLGTSIKSVFRVKNVGDQKLVILGEPAVELVEGC